MAAAAAFFGAGALLLWLGLLLVAAPLLRRRRAETGALASVSSRLGFRGASFRPGRSVALHRPRRRRGVRDRLGRRVPARRRAGHRRRGSPRAADSRCSPRRVLPLHHDPADGRGARRARPRRRAGRSRASRSRASGCAAGEDASCLNLYRPESADRARADRGVPARGPLRVPVDPRPRRAEEKANPWLLLERERRRGRHPRDRRRELARSTSCTGSSGERWRSATRACACASWARCVPGCFQGELVTGERHFLRAFPGEEGYRFFLLDDAARARGRGDGGAGVAPRRLRASTSSRRRRGSRPTTASRTPTSRRSRRWGRSACCWARVGLGAVLLRNAFEQAPRAGAPARGRLPRAGHLRTMVLAENALLLRLLGLGSRAPARRSWRCCPRSRSARPRCRRSSRCWRCSWPSPSWDSASRGSPRAPCCGCPCSRRSARNSEASEYDAWVASEVRMNRRLAFLFLGFCAGVASRAGAAGPSDVAAVARTRARRPPGRFHGRAPAGRRRWRRAGSSRSASATPRRSWSGGRVFVFSREGEDEVVQALDLGDRPARSGGRATRRPTDELGRHRPRQGPEVDAGRRGRPALHARDHGRPLRLRRGHAAACSGARTSRPRTARPRPSTARRRRRWSTGGRLIAHVGGDDDGALTAFDVGPAPCAGPGRATGPATPRRSSPTSAACGRW